MNMCMLCIHPQHQYLSLWATCPHAEWSPLLCSTVLFVHCHSAALCCCCCCCCSAGSVEGLDDAVIEVYRGVGQLLARFTTGKVPKAFKIIPNLVNWEEILQLTDPEHWSPHAM